MEARVQKWGNSLGIRIPKAIAEELGLNHNTSVQLSLVDGKLVISPLLKPTFQLHELLSKVTKKNMHGEIDTGSSTGGEVW
jgi:antitoxin MazE